MREIVLTVQAQEDLDEIYEPLFSEIHAKIQLLREFPHLGSTMEGSFSRYRSLVVHLFRIVYCVPDNNLIQIIYVRHCRRQLT